MTSAKDEAQKLGSLLESATGELCEAKLGLERAAVRLEVAKVKYTDLLAKLVKLGDLAEGGKL
jgi:hypothetical protein